MGLHQLLPNHAPLDDFSQEPPALHTGLHAWSDVLAWVIGSNVSFSGSFSLSTVQYCAQYRPTNAVPEPKFSPKIAFAVARTLMSFESLSSGIDAWLLGPPKPHST